MQGNNFSCPTCKKTYAISSYTMTGSSTFFYKNSKEQLRCDCKSRTILIEITKQWDGGMPIFAKIASMTPQDRSNVLKKRSKEHFKKHILEKKMEMNKQFDVDVKQKFNR